MKGPSLYPKINGYQKGHTPSESKVINSNEITMKEENGAPLEKGNIKGTGLTTGNTKIMKPGKNYTFPGDNKVLETPLAMHKDIPHWKSKAKYRKNGTLKKVVTKNHKDCDDCENYKSTIKFDKDGHIKSAKNNKTKNKHKKSTQRLSKAKWIRRDMTPYEDLAGERW